MRCAAHVYEDGVVSGCADDAVVIVPAVGTNEYLGRPFRLGLCEDHARLIEASDAVVFTVSMARR